MLLDEFKIEIVKQLLLCSEDGGVPNEHLDLCLYLIRAVALLLEGEHEVVKAQVVLLQVGPEFKRVRRLVEAHEVGILFVRDPADAVFPLSGAWAIWDSSQRSVN